MVVDCNVSFIWFSAIAVEWQYSCFVTIPLHYTPPKMTSVLVLFVVFEELCHFIGI